ncbi:PI-PLC X domain-containing protein 3 [Trichonephila clavata]|uniref:PI-PLC X domain-containing protein 3 n=1 Tax=Trichonephila clavata TaxID=2740835 RepID=A0A8X6H6B5_TRICU|nr:PI-PLC X domain-containing protein 3 [Trichonephila clavata]
MPFNNISSVWLIFVGLALVIQCRANKPLLKDVPTVYLTVSSAPSASGQDRLLEMNWDNIPRSDEGRVNVYGEDPSLPNKEPLVSVRPNDTKGYFKTSVRFPVQVFNNSNLTSNCLGFWITYRLGDQEVIRNCLRARPHWMHDSRSTIGNLSLLDLMLPGTHNAGCYASYDKHKDSILTQYLFTQEESIWNQLVYGIRYLDLRVAYVDHDFWITHSSFKTQVTVRDAIRQVKEFLKATKEIVVMDFHRFVTGFQRRTPTTSQRHRDLIALLERELGEFMIPVHYTSGALLEQLWDTDRRLYVGYADERARTSSAYLFPAVKHLWGDVVQSADLWQYLNETVCNPSRRRLISAMAQLTPTRAGALFNLYGGLRKMAENVNRQVTRWFTHDWNQCANIVATDFFLGNNVIELSIETNKRRPDDEEREWV